MQTPNDSKELAPLTLQKHETPSGSKASVNLCRNVIHALVVALPHVGVLPSVVKALLELGVHLVDDYDPSVASDEDDSQDEGMDTPRGSVHG